METPAARPCTLESMEPDAEVRKEETEGRQGKQPDGSAKTREVKLAVTFSADSRDKITYKEILGAENDFGKQWGKERRDDLEAGRIDTILDKLKPFFENCEEAESCRKYLIKE